MIISTTQLHIIIFFVGSPHSCCSCCPTSKCYHPLATNCCSIMWPAFRAVQTMCGGMTVNAEYTGVAAGILCLSLLSVLTKAQDRLKTSCLTKIFARNNVIATAPEDFDYQYLVSSKGFCVFQDGKALGNFRHSNFHTSKVGLDLTPVCRKITNLPIYNTFLITYTFIHNTFLCVL